MNKPNPKGPARELLTDEDWKAIGNLTEVIIRCKRELAEARRNVAA